MAVYAVPDGADGTRETLKYMRELVRASKADVWIRTLAHAIVAGVRPKDWRGEIRAVFEFCRGAVRYSLDPNGVEYVQSAVRTLELGAGDCDDSCVLIASLLEQLGHACAFCAIGFKELGEFSHVIVLCMGAAGETEPIALDATEPNPMGWFPPGATCLMLAPIEEGAFA